MLCPFGTQSLPEVDSEKIERKPERLLHAMDTPLLILGAENDDVNPKEESSILFGKVKAPKQLEIIRS
jgi:hypothetical protein